MSDFVPVDVSILVQTIRFSRCVSIFSHYFHFSANDALNDGSAVLCACWTSPLLLSPLRLQHDGSELSQKPINDAIVLRFSGRQPRPTCPARLPEIALRQPRSPWNTHFYVVVFRRSNTTNNLFFAYFGLRSFPPLELSWCTYSVSSVIVKVFFFFALVFFGSRKLVLTVVYQVLTTNTYPAGEQF